MVENAFSQLQMPLHLPVTVYQDNTSMYYDYGSVLSNQNRTKRIDVSHHHIKDYIRDGFIVLRHLPIAEMVADALTKPLGPSIFFLSTGMH